LSSVKAIIYYDRRRECVKMDIQRPLKQKVSITLDGDIIENIKIYAEKNDRSFSQYINMVLKAHIKRMENSNSKKLKT
jgi:hypothetical protein